MGFGYPGKILFMDLSTRAIEFRRTPKDIYLRFLGGSGLGVKLLSAAFHKYAYDSVRP